MPENYFKKLVKESVQFYYDLAIEKYSDLSSFAIVTDESYDTFIIAINTGKFYKDLESLIISDEDYWNTAEWTEECLDCIYESADAEQINVIISNDNEFTESIFLEACFEALKSIRNEDNSDVCMFIHLTDYGTSINLLNIVNHLNSKNIFASYKKYHFPNQ